ncbi:MAG: hypothetical protein LBR23_00950 [Spirochaetaceae bacterium]|nr:hypothetical protein [Spirochaetaceae bacterium]
MEKAGLIADVIEGVNQVAKGRRYLMTKGETEEGLASFLNGHELLLRVFKEAHTSGDPELMVLAEFSYTRLELGESSASEPLAQSSAEAAVSYFDAAMNTFPLVRDKASYKIVDRACSPHHSYRYSGCPKDAVHVACASDRTRIQNALRRIGVPESDITLAIERMAMLKAAQEAYHALQQEALDG